jgi:general secretion pathway protein J
MERDMSQLAQVEYTLGEGDPLPPLQSDGRRIELTRRGHSNPQGLPRSSLLRVSYELKGDELYRISWSLPERNKDEAGREARLLTDVEGLTLRFLSQEGSWEGQWSNSEGSKGDDQKQTKAPKVPRAIEWVLNLKREGAFKRVVWLTQGYEIRESDKGDVDNPVEGTESPQEPQ